jgi:hypothetical protein
MSDPGSVAAAYAIVLGGLVLYVASIVRRLRAARSTAEALQLERERDAARRASESPALVSRPSDQAR